MEIINQNQDRLPDLKVKDNIVYKKLKFNREGENDKNSWKIWLPDDLTMKIINKSHINNTSHGVLKTLYNVREYFYWPTMSETVISARKSSTQNKYFQVWVRR